MTGPHAVTMLNAGGDRSGQNHAVQFLGPRLDLQDARSIAQAACNRHANEAAMMVIFVPWQLHEKFNSREPMTYVGLFEML